MSIICLKNQLTYGQQVDATITLRRSEESGTEYQVDELSNEQDRQAEPLEWQRLFPC
jgi:hypothetical protein